MRTRSADYDLNYLEDPSGTFTRCHCSSAPKSPERKTIAEQTLDDLFLNMLKDIYYAEKPILKALPKMARAS